MFQPCELENIVDAFAEGLILMVGAEGQDSLTQVIVHNSHP